MRRPIGVKFCTVVNTRSNFVMPSKISGGPPPKNFRGQKHAKFGQISNDFEVRRRISLNGMKIIKIGQIHFVPRFLPRWVKKVKLWFTNHGD